MNITNKKIILIYALSPLLTGIFIMLLLTVLLEEKLFTLIIHANIPFGYLIDYFQVFSLIAGAGYTYGIMLFLLMIIIPSRLVVLFEVKESLVTRLIKIIIIGIGLLILLKQNEFSSINNENINDYLRDLFSALLDVILYIVIFYLTPQKLTRLNTKKSRIDQFIHIMLSGVIGILLSTFWVIFFSRDIFRESIFTPFISSYMTGFAGALMFAIPALLIGVVKIRTSYLNKFKQICLYGTLGFCFPFLLVAGAARALMLGFTFGIMGAITTMLVTIIVNLINTPPVKQPEEISQQQ